MNRLAPALGRGPPSSGGWRSDADTIGRDQSIAFEVGPPYVSGGHGCSRDSHSGSWPTCDPTQVGAAQEPRSEFAWGDRGQLMPMKSTLSVCIVTQDMAHFLGYTLGNISDVADEIVVVDGGSVDGTVELARSFPKV